MVPVSSTVILNFFVEPEVEEGRTKFVDGRINESLGIQMPFDVVKIRPFGKPSAGFNSGPYDLTTVLSFLTP